MEFCLLLETWLKILGKIEIISRKYSQKPLDFGKQFVTNGLKTTS